MAEKLNIEVGYPCLSRSYSADPPTSVVKPSGCAGRNSGSAGCTLRPRGTDAWHRIQFTEVPRWWPFWTQWL